MKSVTILFLLVFTIPAFSQTVVVNEETDRVEGQEVPGVSTTLDITDSREVQKAWTSQLKSYGRTTEREGFLMVPEAYIPGISVNNSARVFSRITLTNEGTKIWWGIEFADKFISKDEYPSKMEKSKKILHQFGVDMYIARVSKEISDAERVIEMEVKNYESLVRSGENFSEEFEKNHLQRVKLKDRLAQNRVDSVNITNLINQNKIDQTESMKEIETLKAAREQIRKKLEGIK